MSVMSLGQRLNWGQLAAWVGQMDQPETLRLQASLARRDEARLGVLFSAVELSGQPGAVANYLMNFGQSGMDDLGASLRYGAGGVRELLQRNQRLHETSWQVSLAVESGPLAAICTTAFPWSLFVVQKKSGNSFRCWLAAKFQSHINRYCK